MDDQKFLKKRLKALMNRPENQVCADCPERQPRWASLIVAPPGAPAGSQAVGAFVCLECSGSHRRLGVHIAFVRSINLDSCKYFDRHLCCYCVSSSHQSYSNFCREGEGGSGYGEWR